MFVYYVITLFALFFILIGIILRRLSVRCAGYHDRLMKFFLWNWCIRLIFEASLELSFCIGLNI